MNKRSKGDVEVYDVHGVLYTVEEVDELEEGHGKCDYDKSRIVVLKSLAPSAKARVKQHELGHASWWESGAWHRHSRALGGQRADEIEEDVMESFLPVLFNVKRVK